MNKQGLIGKLIVFLFTLIVIVIIGFFAIINISDLQCEKVCDSTCQEKGAFTSNFISKTGIVERLDFSCKENICVCQEQRDTDFFLNKNRDNTICRDMEDINGMVFAYCKTK